MTYGSPSTQPLLRRVSRKTPGRSGKHVSTSAGPTVKGSLSKHPVILPVSCPKGRCHEPATSCTSMRTLSPKHTCAEHKMHNSATQGTMGGTFDCEMNRSRVGEASTDRSFDVRCRLTASDRSDRSDDRSDRSVLIQSLLSGWR